MRLNASDSRILSDAIDKMSAGYNTIIEMYNESEETDDIFDEKTMAEIRKAYTIHGEDEVNRKINRVVKEMFEWIPIEHTDDEEDD